MKEYNINYSQGNILRLNLVILISRFPKYTLKLFGPWLPRLTIVL